MICISDNAGKKRALTIFLFTLCLGLARSEFCRSLEICFTQGSEACQASAIAALQSLCDPHVSLRTPEAAGGTADSYLADSLPTRETLVEIMTVLLNPFTCELRTNFSIQLLTIRTFVMLLARGGDHTFVVLTECLAAKNRTLLSFMRKLAVDFDAGSAACRACVAAMTSFLGHLMEVPTSSSSSTLVDSDDTSSSGAAAQASAAIHLLPRRTLCLTTAELAWVVLWTSAGDTAEQVADRRRTHPLTLLQARLTEAIEHYQQSQEQEQEEEDGPAHQLQQLKVSYMYGYNLCR